MLILLESSPHALSRLQLAHLARKNNWMAAMESRTNAFGLCSMNSTAFSTLLSMVEQKLLMTAAGFKNGSQWSVGKLGVKCDHSVQ